MPSPIDSLPPIETLDINTGRIIKPVPQPTAAAFEEPEYTSPGDIPAQRKQIFDYAMRAASEIQPVTNSRYTLKLDKVAYQGPDTLPKAEHKKALMNGTYLTRKLCGTWALVDNTTGKPVEERRSVIAHIPYMTDLGTFAKGGNDYALSHQFRLKPGVYTRWQDNGELEAHVNVSGGIGHKMYLDPQEGIFKLKFGQSNLPAADVLTILGATPAQLKAAWGEELYQVNMQKRDPKALNKLYSKITYGNGKATDPDTKTQEIQQAFYNMSLDPRVSKMTLGKPYDFVNADVLLDTSRKLLRIQHGQDKTDSRDNMAFQRICSPADLIAERFKKASGIMRQQLWKASAHSSLAKVPPGTFDQIVDTALIGSGLGMPLEEVNPVEIYDNQFRVTRLGEGGISSIDAIPDSARNVDPSQMGFVDILRTPESLKAGVDSRLASNLRITKDGRLLTSVRDRRGREQWKSAEDIADSVVAFPNELSSDKEFIPALKGGTMQMVHRDEVNYEFPYMQTGQHVVGNMVPMTSAIKGQRAIMAARMLTQAVPLENPEAPLVQAGIPYENDKSYEELYGEKFGAVRAQEPLKVLAVKPDYITVLKRDGSEEKIELYRDMPFNRKTGFTQTPIVQPGDTVQPGAILAKSNYTDDKGTTAIGLNARVAFMPYRGLNFEDGIIVSESFAKRATSTHYYKSKLSIDKDTTVGTESFQATKPGVYTREQLQNFSKNGVIKPGTIVQTGDPLLLAINKVEPTEAQRKQGRKPSFRDASLTWEHHDPGIVTDVQLGAKGAQVIVKTKQQLKEADKLSGRAGNKGIVSQIIPDDQLPTLPDGTKPEIILTPLGLGGRVNPAQVAEAILGKIASKTGKRYAVKDFQGQDILQFAKDEAKKYGISTEDDLVDDTDPDHPKTIPTIFNGNMFFMKLHHSAESKAQGRGLGRYTSDLQPAKGGEDSAKRMGMMELNALLSHGAVENIRDMKFIKGQENLDYWRQFMAGNTPTAPEVPYVYEKFVNYLKGSGINVVRQGPRLNMMALTSKDVDRMAEGRELTGVRDARTGLQTLPTVSWSDNMKVIPGGLFDERLTGGHAGNQWSYIRIDDKLPNPVMEEPLRYMLGLTEQEFRDVMAGKKKLSTGTGPEAIYAAAAHMNIKGELARAREDIQSGKKTYRDAAVRRLGYLKAAERLGQEPADWFLDKVPVVPPYFRPMSIMGDSKLPLVADPNYLYKQLFDANQAYKANKKVFGTDGSRDLGLAVYDSFKAVTGLGEPTTKELQQKKVQGLLKHIFDSGPKFGMMQAKLLSTPADLAGRGVIAVEPTYDMDTVGIPEALAWDTYKPFVIRELRKHGRTGMGALKEYEEKSTAAKELLQQVMSSRPVLLNRAPTLHKYGLMAMWPQMIKGDSIKINPFVCGGFNADFDGDQQFTFVFMRRGPKSDLHIVHLADFPRGAQVGGSCGQWGAIDWYDVPTDVEVLGYDERTHRVCWMHPTVYSVHHDCPVDIVNTNSGRQIFTDKDPRAIYGINPATFKYERAYPRVAMKKHFVIPRVCYLDSTLSKKSYVHKLCKSGGSGLIDATTWLINKSIDGKDADFSHTYETNDLRAAQELALVAETLHVDATITTKVSADGDKQWSIYFKNNSIEKIPTDTTNAIPDVVPVSLSLIDSLAKLLSEAEHTSDNKALLKAVATAKRKGYMQRLNAKKCLAFISKSGVTLEHYDMWKAIVSEPSITWDYITSVESTGIKETGYDLTVPGADTFTDFQGLVLSNTMVFHVPTTKEATEEAINKMLPSRNLLAAGNFEAMPIFSKENIIGLYESTRRSDKAPRTFETKADVIAAYRQGRIGPTDRVRILSDK